MIGAAALGLLLGFSLRVSAVVAASAAIVVVGGSVAPFTQVSALTAAVTTIGALLTLQCGYIVGLALSCVWSRVRSASLQAQDSTLDVGRWVPER
jgi:hypothetical protein